MSVIKSFKQKLPNGKMSELYELGAKAVNVSTAAGSNVEKALIDLEGRKTSWNDLLDKPSKLPASDVYEWAKQPNKPIYTKNEVGLGSVDNTADINKSVKYAETAGSAKASDVYPWAKASVKPTYSKSEIGLGKVDNTADLEKRVKYAETAGSAEKVPASGIQGIIDISHIPQGAQERLIIVENDTARFKLSSLSVQNGDVVKVVETNQMFYVKDATQLSSESGYEVFAAGSARSVPWSGITGKPETFKPSPHRHSYSEIDNKPNIIDNLNSNSQIDTLSANQGQILKTRIKQKIITSIEQPLNQNEGDYWYEIF